MDETVTNATPSTPLSPKTTTMGSFQFEWVARNIFFRGIFLDLTETEASVLGVLFESRREGIKRSLLFKLCWPEWKDGSSTHTLASHIYRLRQKLEAKIPGTKVDYRNDAYFLVLPPEEEALLEAPPESTTLPETPAETT